METTAPSAAVRSTHHTPRPAASGEQIRLFDFLECYAQGAPISNEQAYTQLGRRESIPEEAWNQRQPIGKSGQLHSPLKRQCRWWQQSLKQLGLLEKVEGARGLWRLTEAGRARVNASKQDELVPAPPGVVMLGFSTDLGIALWGDCKDVFSEIDEPVHLVITSPPYPLARPRAYGNPTQAEFVDWLCRCLEPVVERLVPGGSICLNISNEIFEPGSPARSLYRERLVLALHDRLGLHKMDEIIWHNPSKAPGPLQWASLARVQLNAAWEPVYWFTNDPHRVLSDNRRVLQPHTEAHKRLIERGGERRTGSYGDGANRVRPGAFAAPTEGRIPRNVFSVPHRCPSQREVRALAKRTGLPCHGATMPLELAKTLIEFLTAPDHLVVDLFGGWGTTAVAAETTGRRWVIAEKMLAYVRGAAERFRTAEGFALQGE